MPGWPGRGGRCPSTPSHGTHLEGQPQQESRKGPAVQTVSSANAATYNRTEPLYGRHPWDPAVCPSQRGAPNWMCVYSSMVVNVGVVSTGPSSTVLTSIQPEYVRSCMRVLLSQEMLIQ